MKLDVRRIGLSLAAPLLAVAIAFAVTSLILAAAGDPVGAVWQQLLTAPKPRVTVNIINEAVVLYLSAIAVAIGFRMNLFNIGVEGQYRVAVFTAAAVCGTGIVGGWANVLLGIVVAVIAGALWAGIAGWLKVTRGVSEVISTIMLNAIATGLIAYLLQVVAPDERGDVTRTKEIPESAWLDGLDLIPGAHSTVFTLIFLSVLIGVLYWFVLTHTRFGYDLRAAGRSETAAIASGVDAKKMVLLTMAISGGVAGLVGMPLLFGQDHTYGGTFQAGLGFAGIGIALLGRNHPIGVAIGALLWAYLNQQAGPLQFMSISPEIVSIIQGVIVLAVVIAYEVVNRVTTRMEQASVARRLASGERVGDHESSVTHAAPSGAAIVVEAPSAPASPAVSAIPAATSAPATPAAPADSVEKTAPTEGSGPVEKTAPTEGSGPVETAETSRPVKPESQTKPAPSEPVLVPKEQQATTRPAPTGPAVKDPSSTPPPKKGKRSRSGPKKARGGVKSPQTGHPKEKNTQGGDHTATSHRDATTQDGQRTSTTGTSERGES
ncbi:hypothetical protein KEM60_00867 [Austwickia sp. TVS 96-490-7B]|uniref:ABC transporter permease subunit n=1 Tax=Austwickia sp. TVS 96-490-7B TaxID=2830843 RepID=UPI001DBB9B2B|nr:ABC transporter permease [Austwickia sp. TVS 96-490-7B]MBW3084678.1 hypothetical protein [Austwickia sp. TVS 96-490-7B]